MKKVLLFELKCLLLWGLLGVLTLGTIHTVQIMQLNNKEMSRNYDINVVSMEISNILSNKNGCENNLLNLNISSPPLVLSEIKDRMGNTKFSVDQNIGYSVFVKSINIDNIQNISANEYQAELAVVFEKKGRYLGAKQLTKKYDLYFTETSSLISSCYTDLNNYINTAKEEMCNSFGGTYSSGNCSSFLSINESSYLLLSGENTKEIACPSGSMVLNYGVEMTSVEKNDSVFAKLDLVNNKCVFNRFVNNAEDTVNLICYCH